MSIGVKKMAYSGIRDAQTGFGALISIAVLLHSVPANRDMSGIWADGVMTECLGEDLFIAVFLATTRRFDCGVCSRLRRNRYGRSGIILELCAAVGANPHAEHTFCQICAAGRAFHAVYTSQWHDVYSPLIDV